MRTRTDETWEVYSRWYALFTMQVQRSVTYPLCLWTHWRTMLTSISLARAGFAYYVALDYDGNCTLHHIDTADSSNKSAQE